jgi:hypothetical protein
MKLKSTLIFLFVLFLGLSSFSQTTKVLDPKAGFLNKLIVGDTLANGTRTQTEYILKRDAEYLVSGPFENRGWKLKISAEAGTGKLPIIRAFADLSGNISWSMIGLYGDAEITNIFVDAQPSNKDQKPTAWSFVSNASGANVAFEGCTFVNNGQGAIGIWNAASKVKINNCKFFDMGNLAYWDLGNGRMIDCRSSEVGLLEITNNTIVNNIDRVLRHRGGSGVLKNVIFDHNTIINSASYHGFIELGNVGEKVQITNNLVVDGMGLGADQTDATRLTELDAHGEKDAAGNPKMVWIGSIPNTTTAYTISKNVYTVSPKLQTFYTSAGVNEGPAQILTDHIKGKLGASAATAWVKKDISMVDIPAAMTEVYTWYYSATGGNKKKVTTTAANYDAKSYTYWLSTLNCKYSATDAAFKGTDNVAVGDPFWKSAVIVTGIQSLINSDLNLKIFPNPITDYATLKFYLDQKSDVIIHIYDITGKTERLFSAGNLPSGENSIVVPKGDMNSGVYFLKLDAGKTQSTLKMIVK